MSVRVSRVLQVSWYTKIPLKLVVKDMGSVAVSHNLSFASICRYTTLKLRWFEHQWLVYHGYLKLVLESLEVFSVTADINIYGIIRDLLFLS